MTDRDPTPITGDWRGETLYKCRLCQFDTLEEPKFIAHFASTHPPLEILDGGLIDPAPEPEPEPIAEPLPIISTTRRRGK